MTGTFAAMQTDSDSNQSMASKGPAPTDAGMEIGRLPSIEEVAALIAPHGFGLAPTDAQVHIGDERTFISRDKVVLVGSHPGRGCRVVVKAAKSPMGVAELEREHRCYDGLTAINKKLNVPAFTFPCELTFFIHGGTAISVTEYVERTARFLDLSRREKVALSWRAFEDQRRVKLDWAMSHQAIASAFVERQHATYFRELRFRLENAQRWNSEADLNRTADAALSFVRERMGDVADNMGFLVHTDFVPNNFRLVRDPNDAVSGFRLCYLDLGAFQFANRYESWARYLNWMMLFDPELEGKLLDIVPERGRRCLAAMRVFKATYLVEMYANSLASMKGKPTLLHDLQRARLEFWIDALQALVAGRTLSMGRRQALRDMQERCRSPVEKRRQASM